VLVAVDVLRRPHQFKSRVRAAATRRKGLSIDARNFVALSVRSIVGDKINPGLFNNISGLVDFRCCTQGTVLLRRYGRFSETVLDLGVQVS
jgi:hypothetical protein